MAKRRVILFVKKRNTNGLVVDHISRTLRTFFGLANNFSSTKMRVVAQPNVTDNRSGTYCSIIIKCYFFYIPIWCAVNNIKNTSANTVTQKFTRWGQYFQISQLKKLFISKRNWVIYFALDFWIIFFLEMVYVKRFLIVDLYVTIMIGRSLHCKLLSNNSNYNSMRVENWLISKILNIFHYTKHNRKSYFF